LAGLIRDSAGNFYGTTNGGGASGAGVVFKIDTSGNETVLYSFTGGADGGFPLWAVLARDSAGNLYGTTPGGGASGNGVVFKLDTSAMRPCSTASRPGPMAPTPTQAWFLARTATSTVQPRSAGKQTAASCTRSNNSNGATMELEPAVTPALYQWG
jgi:uncharacterized repeat protein (TIGR03803 family)